MSGFCYNCLFFNFINKSTFIPITKKQNYESQEFNASKSICYSDSDRFNQKQNTPLFTVNIHTTI